MIKEIELSKIIRGTNVRNEKETDIQELAESIDRIGLIHPIKVQSTVDGKYEIIAGHRRYEAMKILGEPFITCDILEEKLNFKEKLAMQVQENIQRKNMSAYELVETFSELEKSGMNVKAIARFFNKSVDWVYMQYDAVRILERDYKDGIPEEKKKLSASVIKAQAKKRIQGAKESIACRGFTLKKQGHSYMLYFANFEAEQAFNEFVKKFEM